MHQFSQILFWSETLHFSDNSVHHQEFLTVHTATVYVIHVFSQLPAAVSTPRPHFTPGKDPVATVHLELNTKLEHMDKFCLRIVTVADFCEQNNEN